jgi:hypothetical protein
MSKRILIVEGNADVFFFDALKRVFEIKDLVVSPPASVTRANGKFHAISCLGIYSKQLLDRSIDRLGLVVDADTPLEDQKRGVSLTLQKIDQQLAKHNFHRASLQGGGYVYTVKTNIGKFEIGVWIMPDCASDGSLETFVRNQIPKGSEQGDWFSKAQKAVAALDGPLFDRAAHGLKAEVSTWLAWQKYPGKGMQSVVGDALIDLNGGTAGSLKNWMKRVFP